MTGYERIAVDVVCDWCGLGDHDRSPGRCRFQPSYRAGL